MQKNIEKQLEQFVRGQIAGIHRIQMMNGTMYLLLDKPNLCDFVPEDVEAPVFTDEEESDIDVSLNLEIDAKEGK